LKPSLQLFALPGLPMVQAGDDLAGLLSAAIERAGLTSQSDDVLAVAQKIVSKVEGRSIALASVKHPKPRVIWPNRRARMRAWSN